MTMILRIAMFSMLTIMLLAFSQTASAQNIPEKGTLGIRASIQGGQSDLLFPYRMSDNLSIAPLIGFLSVVDGDTSFRAGLKPQYYLSAGNDFATYIGLQGVVHLLSFNDGDNETSLFFGINGGGEYYLSPKFSLGVEGLINIIFNDNKIISTGAGVAATYYF